jgi:EpsI family protein
MALRIAETRLENQQTGAERLAWHWYEVGGRNVAQPARAKLAQLLGRLSGRQDAAAFVISTDGRDLDAARLVLMSFVSSNLKALQGACQLITPNST